MLKTLPFLGFIILFPSSPCLALMIRCQSLFEEKSFLISNNSVILKEKDGDVMISASPPKTILSPTPSTLTSPQQSLVRNFSWKDHHYKIYLKDLEKSQEAEDVLTIISPKGYQIIYPLKCQNISESYGLN